MIWNEKNKEANLVYLIGVKNSEDEKTKEEAINFSNINNLKLFSISEKNGNDIKELINDLLKNLEKKNK